MKYKKYVLGTLFLALFLACDQISKYYAIVCLKGKAAFPVIKDIFELHYLENHGAAFGILQNQRILLLVVTIAIIAVVGIFFWKLPDEPHFLPLQFLLLLLAAGAVGNLTDRFFRGYVVDFFYFMPINFPIFNVADCYVVVAAALGFLLGCFYYTEEDFSFLKRKRER